MNEKLNIKENTNVREDDPESIVRSRKIGQAVLGIVESADIVNVDKDKLDWDDFQVEDEGTSRDERGIVTLVPTDMVKEIESVEAA